MDRIIIIIMFVSFFNGYPTETDSLITVNSLNSLKSALRVKNKKIRIFISGDVRIDLSNEKTLEIPEGIIFESDRGENGSLGALLYSNNFATNPMFVSKGNNTIIRGIRFRGPDDKIRQLKEVAVKVEKAKKENKKQSEINLIHIYGIPNSMGLKIYGKNNVINNCEIYGWSYASIYIEEGSEVVVKNSSIHHNQRLGLGYGILVQGIAHISNNIFDYNRHAIASSGKSKASYEAHHNICLEHSTLQSHIFDVHGGIDRKDGTDLAGIKFLIYKNVFFIGNKVDEVFMIRGRPKKSAHIFDNTIFVTKMKDFDYIIQTKGQGNFYEYSNEVKF